MVLKCKNFLRYLKCTAVHKIIEVLQDTWSTKITNYQVHVSLNGHETILNFPATTIWAPAFLIWIYHPSRSAGRLADKNFEKLILLKSNNAYKWNIVIAMSLKVCLSDVLEMYFEVLFISSVVLGTCTWSIFWMGTWGLLKYLRFLVYLRFT